MSKERADKLEEAKGALDTLLQQGQIDKAAYFKALIAIAFEWLDMDDIERVADLVGDLTFAYTDRDLPTHMGDDPVFRQQALAVARALYPTITNEEEAEVELLLLRAPSAKA